MRRKAAEDRGAPVIVDQARAFLEQLRGVLHTTRFHRFTERGGEFVRAFDTAHLVEHGAEVGYWSAAHRGQCPARFGPGAKQVGRCRPEVRDVLHERSAIRVGRCAVGDGLLQRHDVGKLRLHQSGRRPDLFRVPRLADLAGECVVIVALQSEQTSEALLFGDGQYTTPGVLNVELDGA
ncbi:hypothetical protein D9M70_347990 [compost metagenome]